MGIRVQVNSVYLMSPCLTFVISVEVNSVLRGLNVVQEGPALQHLLPVGTTPTLGTTAIDTEF